MELKKLEYDLTVCKVEKVADIDMTADFFFIGETDEEISLVCKTEDTPKKQQSGMMAGKGSVYRGYLIFP